MAFKILPKWRNFAKSGRTVYNLTGQVLDGDKAISDRDSSVSCCRTSLHDLRDVDAVVAGNVLVVDAAGNGEPETLGALDQFDF